jgi:hypothetical protein
VYDGVARLEAHLRQFPQYTNVVDDEERSARDDRARGGCDRCPMGADTGIENPVGGEFLRIVQTVLNELTPMEFGL